MGILTRIINRFLGEEREKKFTPTAVVTYAGSVPMSERGAMMLSVVYRCVDLISNSVAQLPIRIYDKQKRRVDNDLSYIVNERPNNTINRYDFIKLLVSSMILRGNAYAIVERDERMEVKALRFVNPDTVTIKTILSEDNGTVQEVFYQIGGKVYEAVNVLHLINFSYDGINGVSTLTHALNSLQIAQDSEATARSFFSGGCNLGGTLTVQGTLDEEQKKELGNSWMDALSTHGGRPQGVIVLEGGMEYKPISVNPQEAQLLESRKFNVIDLCRFFGVSPTKVFDLSKSSYSTIEAEALAFLSDTLQPYLAKIECELQAKLLSEEQRREYDVKFDTTQLLRTDKNSLASYFSTLFNIGVLSQNEIRSMIDLEPIAKGDKHYIQVNLATNGADGAAE